MTAHRILQPPHWPRPSGYANGIAARGETVFGHYLAGQLAFGRALSYFYAPTVNSYKRYQSGSFAPTIILRRSTS